MSFADESDKEDKTGKSVENQEQCTVQFRFKNFTKTKKIFFLLFKVHFSFGTTSFFFISNEKNVYKDLKRNRGSEWKFQGKLKIV